MLIYSRNKSYATLQRTRPRTLHHGTVPTGGLHIHLHLGALGVWIAMIFDWLFKAIIFLIRYKVRKLEPRKVLINKEQTS